MNQVVKLNKASSAIITDHLDIWTSAIKQKSSAGRGSSGKTELYGIKKLRELILELAVRGLLVPQDPNDEPASQLLKRITTEKAILVKEGKIKKPKPFPPVSTAEEYFPSPKGWAWVRIQEIGHDLGQTTPSEDFTYIDVSSINKNYGHIENPSVLTAKEAPSRARKNVSRGTVIYSTVRPYLLNIAVIGEDFTPSPIASTAFAIVHPLKGVSAQYVYRYLRSPTFIKYVEGVQTGIAYPAINDKQFFSGLIALPPEQEQHRIVDKVDELMAFCDQLEQQTEASLSAHQTLVEALLGALTNAADHDNFQQAWQRIAQHFDTLFTTEHSIDQLKQTILQLAVMGKLVPQDPNDEPASELLKRITKENRLATSGKGKKQKPLPALTDQEKPTSLPKGWACSRLGEIIKISSGDGLTSAQMAPGGAIPVFGGNGINGYHDKANIQEPTLVIGRVGFYCGSIHITPTEAWVTDNAFVTSFSEELFTIHYLALLLKGTDLKENENATAQPVISGKKVYPIPVSFPPKKEQHRIIRKYNELIDYCDQLTARLNQSQTTQLQLADALTEQAIA